MEVGLLLATQLVAGLEGWKRRTGSPQRSVLRDAPTSLTSGSSPDTH